MRLFCITQNSLIFHDKSIVMKYIGDIFMSLLDTSATKVDIFWMSLNLAKGTVQECIVIC